MHSKLDIAAHCQNCSLAELCLPRGLSVKETATLDELVLHKQTLKKGERLYRGGDADKSLYAVRSGSFKTVLTTQDGDEQVLGFHLPGDLMGFDAFAAHRHTCDSIALETAAVCELPLSYVDDLHDEIPSLHEHIRSLVGREISADNTMLLLLGKKQAEERLASFLVSLSNRFQERHFSGSKFNLSMSRQDIGNYLGMAVETVSRLFAKLQEQGIVHVEKRLVTIHDMDRLKQLVGTCVAYNV